MRLSFIDFGLGYINTSVRLSRLWSRRSKGPSTKAADMAIKNSQRLPRKISSNSDSEVLRYLLPPCKFQVFHDTVAANNMINEPLTI